MPDRSRRAGTISVPLPRESIPVTPETELSPSCNRKLRSAFRDCACVSNVLPVISRRRKAEEGALPCAIS